MDFDTLWQTYPRDLCNRKGSRKEAEKLWDKLDEKTQDQVIVNMREIMRVDRKLKKAGEFVSRWPMVTTWLRQERFVSDMEDIRMSDEIPKGPKQTCSCGQLAVITRFCESCYEKRHPDPWQATRKNELVRLGLASPGADKRAVIAACREHLLKTGLMERTLGGGKTGNNPNIPVF